MLLYSDIPPPFRFTLPFCNLAQSILAAILCLVSQLLLKDSTSSFGNRVSAKKGDMERVDEESTILGLIITTHCEGVLQCVQKFPRQVIYAVSQL